MNEPTREKDSAEKQKAAYMSPKGKRVYLKGGTTSGKGGPQSGPENPGVNPADENGRHQVAEQLLQSQRLEALGTLVGGIAHDFNNILNVITGHASLMEKWREDPERFMKSFEAVKKASERGASMARQLLTFTRKVDITKERVRVEVAVREIVGFLKDTFPENIVFKVDAEPDMPVIAADPNQIHQALLNLCVNARDAMPNGGTIRIAVRKVEPDELSRHFQEAEPGRFVQLAVSDTGSGMKQEVLAQIFEPFFTTKGGLGTGLGLAVVYGIMKAHDGFIDVETSLGQGTTFYLYFRVGAQNQDILSQDNAKSGPRAGHGEKILAIEDEEPLKNFLNTILTENGYNVLLASDGLEGLKIYRQHMKEIDLVLLDMGLPEMSGREVLSDLLLLNPDAAVISASGYLDPNVEADALEMGALEFLPKPYRIEELLTKVQRALLPRDRTYGR